MRSGAICVLAKVPRPGRVKTRLARTLGDERAAALAEAFLEDTLAGLGATPASVILALDEDAPGRWHALAARVWMQGDGSLGDRLERVLGRALEDHPWAVALGADSPGLPVHLLNDAATALDPAPDERCVLGPCRDGGFYLLGVRRVKPGMLAGVRWSTPDALDDTEGSLRLAGLSPVRLALWFDVDEPDDLVHLRTLIEGGQVCAPATARLLSRSP